jgi:acetyl-CoA carboxylase biotin carboxylase subunit
MIEESPCVALSPEIRAAMGEAAIRAAQAVDYRGAGTLEFLLDGDAFYFMEMNTRIQVEHPVTEAVTGIDLVREQLLVGSGQRLTFSQADVKQTGHAIEVRLTAEDPERNFAPSAGTIGRLILPGGFGVRVDTHVFGGYMVPPYYDSLLAKIIAWGRTREEAVTRITRCLDETRVEGIHTTLNFHRKLVRSEGFRRGDVSTNFIRKLLTPQQGG